MVAKVTRSRRSCTNSLRIMAPTRRQKPPRDEIGECAHDTLSLACAINPMKTSSSEASIGFQSSFASSRWAAMAASSAARSRPDTCRLVPNGATLSTPGRFSKLGGKLHQALAGHAVGGEIGLLHDLVHRAVRQEFAIGDIRDLVAALGLVHVMGRHQRGEPARGERMDLVPELAPGLGIDAGGRLVEQQKLRMRQGAGAERQPLLPAAGQQPGDLVLAAGEAEMLDHLARCLGRLRQPVDARDELQVLLHREVLIETEALRHVADLALDLLGLGADVVAQTSAGALVGRQQTAQHADRGGLAGAVGAEKAVDGAALDLQRQIADHRAAVECLGQAVDIDDDVGLQRSLAALTAAAPRSAHRLAGRREDHPAFRCGPRSGTRAWSAHQGCRSPAA